MTQLDMFAAPAAVLHFPVTSSFWRGVWGELRDLRRPLRRACDWAVVANAFTVSFRSPTCDDCLAYRSTLVRLGRLRNA